MILVMSVFNPEVKPLLEVMLKIEEGELLGRSYTRGFIGKNEVVVASGFVGKVETAALAQKFIDEFSPRLIVMTSGAGAIDSSIEPGTVVIGSEFLEYDLYLPLRSGHISVPTTASVALDHIKQLMPDATYGRIITGDQILADTKKRDELFKQYHACCLDMDSAALARVAKMNRVPFLVIKVILDKCDENSENDFGINFERYGQKPAKILAELLRTHVLEIK